MTIRQREVKRDRLYTEGDADLKHIKDKCITTIGYGSQGHAQALNLRDSGLNVIVGNQEDRFAAEARADGFDVMPIVQAVKRADVILFLIPDEVQAAVYSEIEPYLREGQVLDFASGYSVHFGLIRPLPFLDVVLTVPTCRGTVLRERIQRGQGVFGHFGVYQDHSGKARDIAMALAKGMGLLKFGCTECSFGQEVVVNLFAESAGLGAIPQYLLTAYEVLIEAGFSAEAAYAETFYELQFFVENLVKERLANSRQGSSTSTYLILSKTSEVVDDHVRDNMRRMLGRIQSGELVREWNLEHLAGAPMLHQRQRALDEHEIKDVEDVFLERKKATGW